jgi:tetratricopeptide (TPR) repeat protein
MLPRIVLLAHQIRRPDEAARYALLAAERTEVSPALLRQLAVQLSARQEWSQALALFEASLPANALPASPPGEADEDIAALLVYLEIGRLALLTRDFPKSADYFARVQDALENPGRLAQNEAVKSALLGQAERTYRLMAEAFFLAERYENAEAAVRRAFPQPEGQRAPPQRDFQLARIAAKRGQTDEAMRSLESYFAAQSSAAGGEPYALLAELLGGAEPDSAAADQQLHARLEKLLESDPQNTALMSYLAELEFRLERFEAAEQRYEQLLVLQPAADVYRGLADIYGRQNRTEKLAELCGIMVAKGGSLSDLTRLLESLEEYPELRGLVIALVQQQRHHQRGFFLESCFVAEVFGAIAGSLSPAGDSAFFECPASGGVSFRLRLPPVASLADAAESDASGRAVGTAGRLGSVAAAVSSALARRFASRSLASGSICISSARSFVLWGDNTNSAANWCSSEANSMPLALGIARSSPGTRFRLASISVITPMTVNTSMMLLDKGMAWPPKPCCVT